MTKKSYNNDYKIADISQEDEQAIKKVEHDLKCLTGKDFIVIAWEKK